MSSIRPAHRRMALSGLLTCVTLVAWASPAAAHAAVTSASPAQGSHVSTVPRAVTINFDQPVQPDDGGLVVLNSGGQQVQIASQHPAPATLRAVLPASLGPGAYVSDYTVTSVDGHVVSGGIVFLVGHVTATAGAITSLSRPRTPLASRVDDFGQFLVYLGVLVATGLAFFLAFILRGGPEERRLRRWTYGTVALGLVGMLVTGAAQADLTGGGLGALAHWSIDTQAYGGKFGQQCAAQLVGLALCLASLHVRATIARQFAAFYGLLIAAGAFVLFGHAIVSPERWLSIPADIVHVIFVAMWAGGIFGLVTVLRRRVRATRWVDGQEGGLDVGPGPRDGAPPAAPEDDRGLAGVAGARTAVLERTPTPAPVLTGTGGRDPIREGALLANTSRIVGRFSTMAGISFAGILVAGTLLAVTEVGSVANLFQTGYGQLLLVKIALVGLLLFLAGYNRYLLLPGLLSAAVSDKRPVIAQGWRRLVSTVRLEAIGMVAVLGVTAVLANGTPSNGSLPPAPVPFHQSQPFDGGRVTLHITPNQALVNNWTVQFTAAGGAAAELAESVSVYLVLPSQNVGPIEEDMKKVGVGRFVLANSPNPPIVGTWQIVLQVQVSEFSQPDVSFTDIVH
jgi:copper transport protein